jgi:hypothetical protein
MDKYTYDIVTGNGELVMEVITSFTNLTKDEYLEQWLAGSFLKSLSASQGERVFVASWKYSEGGDV